MERTNFKSLIRFGTIALLFLGLHSGTSAQVPLVILEDPDVEYLIEDIRFFEDARAELGLDEIVRLQEQGSFQAVDPQHPVSINRRHLYWLVFEVKNQSGREREWVFDFQNWSFVDLFLMEGNSPSEVKRTGHLLELEDRDYPYANRNYCLVLFKPGETKSFYVCLDPRPNNRIFPADLSFKIDSRSLVDEKDGYFRGTVYALLSAYLIFLLFNLFIFISTRDQPYFYYLLLVASGLLLTLNYSGFFLEFFSFLKPTIPLLFYSERFVVNGYSIFLVLFTLSFFDVKTRYPKTWYKFFIGLLIALSVSMVVMLFDYDIGLIPSVPTFLVLTVSTLIFAAINVREKYPSAFYYLIGFSLVWISGGFMILASVFGLIELNDYTAILAFPFGQMMEMLVFSFALANMVNVLKQENEEKNQQIIEQYQENAALQNRVQLELEEKVAERTREIAQQSHIIEEEKNRAEALLLNILPRETAEELKVMGNATPRFYDQVTILFADFSGFTQISERLSPDDLIKDLDYCFRAFDDIISRNNLEKIKTIGDAYMCAGGIPTPTETNAVDAVRAAVEIRKFIRQWNQEKGGRGEAKWELRIGIHTGSVTAGVVGKMKFAYDIWGDAVNVASRMEENCGVGEINISSHTYHLVKNLFECRYRGKIKAKNKGYVEMYYVLGPLQEPKVETANSISG